VTTRINDFFHRNATGFAFVFIWIAGALFFSLNKEYTEFSVFHARDLERAHDLLAGHWIWHGPETTGGGYLPGNLYYLLLSLFTRIKGGWETPWLGMLILASLAGAGTWLFLKRFYGNVSALIWIFIYFGSIFNSAILRLFYNPSFAFPFVLASICTTIFTYAYSGSLLSIVGSFVFLAFGIQFHFSLISIFLSLFVFQFFASQLGLVRPSHRHFMIALITGLLPLTPYLLFVINPDGSVPGIPGDPTSADGFILSRNDDIFPWWGYHIRKFGFGSLTLSLLINLLVVTPIGFLVAFLFRIIFRQRNTKVMSRDSEEHLARTHKILLVILLTSSAPAFVVLLYISRMTKLRYLLPFALSLQVITSIWVSTFVKKYLRSRIWTFGFILIFAAITISSYFHLSNFLVKGRGLYPFNWELKAGINYIYKSTCWNINEMRERIFLVGIHSQASVLLPHDEKCDPHSVESGIKGSIFFMSPKVDQFGELTSLEIIDTLKKHGVEGTIISALESGEVRFGRIATFGRLNVIPMIENVPFSLPLRMHNVGYPYAISPLDRALTIAFEKQGKIMRLGPSTLLLKNRACPLENLYCQAGFLLEFAPLKTNETKQTSKRLNYVDVSIVGQALSQPSVWVRFSPTAAWSAPQISFLCKDGISQKALLANAVGNRPAEELFKESNYFLAPFSKRIKMSCNSKLESIEIKVDSSLLNTVSQQLKNPGFSISVSMRDFFDMKSEGLAVPSSF
jgi:hypothetical protein